MVKNLPAMQETWVQPLGWGDSPGEGNGKPLQFSCLENSIHRAAWQAIVFVSLFFSSLYKSYYSSARWNLDEKQVASQASDLTEDTE